MTIQDSLARLLDSVGQSDAEVQAELEELLQKLEDHPDVDRDDALPAAATDGGDGPDDDPSGVDHASAAGDAATADGPDTDEDPSATEDAVDEVRNRIDELESEIDDTAQQLDSIEEFQNGLGDQLDELDDSINRLVGAYDQITDPVNPFTDDPGTTTDGATDEGRFGVMGSTDPSADDTDASTEEQDVTFADLKAAYTSGRADGVAGRDADGPPEAGAEETAEDTADVDADTAGTTDAEPATETAQRSTGSGAEDVSTQDGDPRNDGVAPDDVDEGREAGHAGSADANRATVDGERRDSVGRRGDQSGREDLPGGVGSTEMDPGLERAASAAGDAVLVAVPKKYAADILVFEWLSHLVMKTGPAATLKALEYYRQVGWLTDDAKQSLVTTLSGPELDVDVDPSEPEDLTAEDHAFSYVQIQKLNELNDFTPPVS